MRALRVAAPCVLALLAGCNGDGAKTKPVPSASAAPVRCAEGRSIDPKRAELRAALTAYDRRQYAAAAGRLERLRSTYPESATVRVWLAEVKMMQPSGDYRARADEALRLYDEALDLHRAGCRLPESPEYALRIGIALAHLRKKEPEKAIEQLKLCDARWSRSAEVHYNVARAHCSMGNVDECAARFEKTLELARQDERPTFLRNHNSLDDWVRRSKTQSEFPKLRADPRYAAIVEKYTGQR